MFGPPARTQDAQDRFSRLKKLLFFFVRGEKRRLLFVVAVGWIDRVWSLIRSLISSFTSVKPNRSRIVKHQKTSKMNTTSDQMLCQHWLLKGSCKYDQECRFSHDTPTLARRVTSHPHLLGPDQASKRKKFFCDICQKKSVERFRCTVGCDYDLCVPCFQSSAIEDDDRKESQPCNITDSDIDASPLS